MEAKLPVTKAVCAALGQYRRAGESCFRWARLHLSEQEQEAVRTLARNTRDLDSLPTAPERAARILEGLEVRVAPSLLAGAVWGTESCVLVSALEELLGEKRPRSETGWEPVLDRVRREVAARGLDLEQAFPGTEAEGIAEQVNCSVIAVKHAVAKLRRERGIDVKALHVCATGAVQAPPPPPYDPARRKVDPVAEWRREVEFNSGGRITFAPLPTPEEEPMEVKSAPVEVSNQPVSANGKEPAPLTARERLTAMVDRGEVDISQYLPTARQDAIAATLGVTGSRVGQIVKALREERGITLPHFSPNARQAEPAAAVEPSHPAPEAAELAAPPQPQPALTNWSDEQLADAPQRQTYPTRGSDGLEEGEDREPFAFADVLLYYELPSLGGDLEQRLALDLAAGCDVWETFNEMPVKRRLAVLLRAAAVIETVTR